MSKTILRFVLFCTIPWWGMICTRGQSTNPLENPFQPIGQEWPTPSEARLGSGAPGPDYWQQQADYDMEIVLDDLSQKVLGKATIHYYNNSPHSLGYLWLQLDQNQQNPHALGRRMQPDASGLERDLFETQSPFKGGMEISSITDMDGNLLDYTIVETNLRIDLKKPLSAGQELQFKVTWSYNINDARTEGRSGYEYFASDGNYIYEIAQFYPRMCAYYDLLGWQNTPYLGPSEFALEFGDYTVKITVPDDHLVASTGLLVNEDEVLTKKQMMRLNAIRSQEGVLDFVVSPKESALATESKSTSSKTWIFRAENVRDFAFASSRKFIWDAASKTIGGKKVLAQSFYPKEAMPLWDKYATHTIMHTLQVYSRMLFDYPYPTATAVHGPVWGMEYPMLCFCGGRPLPSGFYSRQAKYLMIGVIIHEVGHNFFPMVVNTDERRWAWMDEGLNSFCQYVAENEFEPNFPYRRGPADAFAPYMAQSDQQPIMTNPDAIRDNGKISYEKVAVGLNILRNEVMGPELFDGAIRNFAKQWMFKRPEPADFFRSMDDHSGMQLDWFWREWFYGTKLVDLAITGVVHGKMPMDKAPFGYIDPHLLPEQKESEPAWYVSDKPELKDKYTESQPTDRDEFKAEKTLLDEIRQMHKAGPEGICHVYQVKIKRLGPAVMPVKLKAYYMDGSSETFSLPAEMWMQGRNEFTKRVFSAKEAYAFVLDSHHGLPDIKRENNIFPNPSAGLRMTTQELR